MFVRFWPQYGALEASSWDRCARERWTPAVHGRLVVYLGQPPILPVHAHALVFSVVHLGTVPLASGALRTEFDTHAPGSHGRTWVPVRECDGLRASSRRARSSTGRGDRGSIFFRADTLLAFEDQIIAVVAFLLVLTLGPLLVFSPQLARARRMGLREYGNLAERYVRDYDKKWLRGGLSAGEPLLGSSDIQSLADLGNSFQMVQNMRIVAFSRDTVLRLLAVALLPVAPLLLTMLPLRALVSQLLKIVV